MIANSACPLFRALVVLLALAFVGPSQAIAAKRDCETSLRLKPDHTEYVLSRGICHLNNGDADLAIADFNQFIERNPDWVAGYFNRGNAHFAKQDYDLAIADYDEAMRHKPADPDGIILNRGNAFAEKRDYRRAIADYDQAIGMKPRFADFYRVRAVAYEKAGEKDAAIADYRKALALDPSNRAAANGLAELTGAVLVPSLDAALRQRFERPRYGDVRLDWCRYWAQACGKGAADEFCRRHGFAESAAFAQAPGVGKDEPTTIIGSGEICNGRNCNGFATISCRN